MTQNPANMVMVHSKACDNCRRLRVGCDRELPQCGRCRLAKNTCTYQHQLKREAKVRKTNQYESTLHTYRAFLPPPEEELSSRPLVLKWVDVPTQEKPEQRLELDPAQGSCKASPRVGRMDRRVSKGCTSRALSPSKNFKQRAMIKLVSNQGSLMHSTSLQKMFFVLIGARFTKNIKAPLAHLSQGRNNTFFIRCLRGEKLGDKNQILVRLDEQSRMTPALLALRNAAYDAHFRYENSLFMLFLGRKGFECMFRSQLLHLSVFLSGLQYIPGVDKSLALELITLTTEQLKQYCLQKNLASILFSRYLFYTGPISGICLIRLYSPV
ncbi:hypothetical protein DSO57_1013833 [Entomophthora muscae]|uniref:Uncharacterized protein n=1 Tax=Entomophthora muscae TaxID=34485 RepID=A0ACC2SIG4_9FUNG|nr:hypothetical protein DSO57_1013833 [Entomophthora muscae]